MHQPIQDNLEDYLSGRLSGERLSAFEAQLRASAEDRAMVETCARQAKALRTLKTDVEPSAGFYARVMERIEAQRGVSLWSLFLEPVFGKRLAFGALALFVLLSGVAFTSASDNAAVASTLPEQVLVYHEVESNSVADVQHDRGVVLATLASWDDSQASGLQFSAE